MSVIHRTSGVGVTVGVLEGVAVAAAGVFVGVLVGPPGVLVAVAVAVAAPHAGHHLGVLGPKSYQAVTPRHVGLALQKDVTPWYPCGPPLSSQSTFAQ